MPDGTGTGRDPQDEVLDLLIVGGGPAGTAAAFRSKELGLKALVIDYDDVMKRIRDYAEGKPILPNFGGDDRTRFPKGAECVAELRFAPIDKNDMCVRWKGLYERFGVASRTPVELLGIETGSGGIHEVLAFDHAAKSECRFRAKFVVLAIGRGVPRRFDIPGNTDGIAYRLSDPSLYARGPVCVIGGGTSAAEAVIAVSKAKGGAGDASNVFWSYRGDKLPRVSKSLADDFFECYVGSGNIRYFPRSEPAAVVTGDDGIDYLSIRIERTCVENRPPATAHLEFSKDNVIACIGEDLPKALMASLGIRMRTGGPSGKERFIVNRFLESERKNVFLIGDTLSQIYLEAESFDSDPSTFQERSHLGNIKFALRDGVLVASVIQQRLAGRSEIETRIDDDEEPAATVSETEKRISQVVSLPRIPVAPPPPGVEPPPKAEDVGASVTRLLPTGVYEHTYPVARPGLLSIGRAGCDATFPNDSMLSERHASVTIDESGSYLRDDGSETGTFVQLRGGRKTALQPGDILRAGRQFFVMGEFGGRPTAIHYDAKGKEVGRYEISSKWISLGREGPDVFLDGADTSLSRRHLSFGLEDGKLRVVDLKSSNGTFLRVRGSYPLEDGDQFRVGQQRFLFRATPVEAPVAHAEPAVPPAPPVRKPEPPPKAAEPAVRAPAPTPVVAPAPATKPTTPTVAFKGGGTFVAKPGQTILDVAEANGVAIESECRGGACGYDPVRILAGAENLEPLDSTEKDTLEDRLSLKPGECRLACMATVKGPVEVEVLKK